MKLTLSVGGSPKRAAGRAGPLAGAVRLRIRYQVTDLVVWARAVDAPLAVTANTQGLPGARTRALHCTPIAEARAILRFDWLCEVDFKNQTAKLRRAVG
jgi:hypothetical protein